jgi:hypothetical protein
VATLEDKQVEDGWLAQAAEGGSTISPGWMAVEALQGIDWLERHQAYKRWFSRSCTGKVDSVLSFTYAWCALVQAWSEAGQVRADSRRSLAAVAGDIASMTEQCSSQLAGLRTSAAGNDALSSMFASAEGQLDSARGYMRQVSSQGGSQLGSSFGGSGMGFAGTRRPALFAGSAGRFGGTGY